MYRIKPTVLPGLLTTLLSQVTSEVSIQRKQNTFMGGQGGAKFAKEGRGR